jgi:hypothetical protein
MNRRCALQETRLDMITVSYRDRPKTRPSKRLSSWELLNLAEKDKALQAELDRQRAKPKKQQQEVAYER